MQPIPIRELLQSLDIVRVKQETRPCVTKTLSIQTRIFDFFLLSLIVLRPRLRN